MESSGQPIPVAVGTYESGNSELTECLQNFMDVYGEDVDPTEVWESVTKVHGFDVDFDTVKTAMETLRNSDKKMETNRNDDADAGGGEVNIHVSFDPNIQNESSSRGRRKFKLTDTILQLVSTTLDEEEVHSLLSLKRALELKGVNISKTSVYRALEKLGRSIVEKKKKTTTPARVTAPKGSPKTAGKPAGRRTVAEMLAKRNSVSSSSSSTKAGSLIVTSDGKAMILAPNQPHLGQPQKKLRALLPKPSTKPAPVTPVITAPAPFAAQAGTGSGKQRENSIGTGLMQITKETVPTSSPMTTVASPAVLRTQQVLTLPGAPSIGNAIIQTTTAPQKSLPPATADPEKKKKITQESSDPVIKIEIDDPSEPEAAQHHPIMNTVTPPPRTSDLHSNEGYHHSERLTKSVSPQLMSSQYDTYARVEKDAKGRAIQQFRLNKAIGKITNMRSQGQVSRAPRKPAVVFHRPSSNSTPIPFRVRHEPSHVKSLSQQDGRKQSQHAFHGQSNGRRASYTQGRRTLQMMRAARQAQLRSFMRSGLHKLHPTNLSGGRVVSAVANNRRRMAARLPRHEVVSPLYYQSDLDEEDFLTELEIDPPDNYSVNEELTTNSEERQERRDSGGESGEILREMFQEMTKEMRRLSQHMETIQGQLQLIVEQMPSLLHQQRLSPTEMRHLTSNGHTPSMEVPSPVSNDDHSPDTVDDTDDNTMENTHNQESPPSAKESREIPTLGTPASDALIREVLDDVRWDQMTPYAGAPRLAIALARYCIFGTKVLMESSVTGRNSKNPLNNVAMKKIKELLREKYGSRCNHLEFEMVWKTSRESISQLCKRLRRKYQLTGRVMGGQEDYILDNRQ